MHNTYEEIECIELNGINKTTAIESIKVNYNGSIGTWLN